MKKKTGHPFILILLIVFCSIGESFAQSCNLASEGFENGGSFPNNWTSSGIYIGTTNPYSGIYHAGFNTNDDALSSANLACPKNVCFFWRTSGSTSSFDIDIEWSDNLGLSWNNITKIRVQDSSSITTYRKNCLDLSGIVFTNPSQVKIRFIQKNRSAGSWYLDDICITSSNASKLSYSSITTGCVLTNSTFSVSVCALDNCGNTDSNFTGTITLSKNTGSGSLSGTTSKSATSGCATFSDLTFSLQDSYTITASATSLTSVNSSVIEIKNTCPLTDTLTVITYNLLNFPNGRNDCGTNLSISNRVDTLKKIMTYLKPDILMVCELQDETGANLILNNALNVNGITHYKKANFIENQSTSYKILNNMFYYNSNKVKLKKQDEILTGTRDVGEYIVYGADPNLSSHNDTTFIDFYECHLKAGSAAGDISDRASECLDIRNYIDLKPSGRNNIIGGDFNFYDAAESGYQTLCYSGTYPFKDPISSEGAWTNNSTYAPIHTQATRSSEVIECGAIGGMDDRFDFLLTSSNVLSGSNRVKYITNSYTAVGNNGSTFNKSINDVANSTAVPDDILNALYYMSDHLPITMKLAVTYPTSIALPIQLTDFEASYNSEVDSIEIYWQTYSERDNDYFILEKSNDGTLFTEIKKIKGNGTTNKVSNYSVFDEKSVNMLVYYRLKQIDYNGKINYSKTISIYDLISKIKVSNVYPNPTVENATIDIYSPTRADIYYKITDFSGKTIEYKLVEIKKGENHIPIISSHLSKGIYTIQLSVENKLSHYLKLIKY